jgi:MFS family permease
MQSNSSNHQLIYLFMSSFTILFVGMGLFPLLPLYAAHHGATTAMIGIYFALVYIASALAPLFTSWAARKMGRRVLFISAAAAGVPALALMGVASAFWQVIALTAFVWFVGGVDLTLINIYTGMYTRDDERGKIFSLLALSAPLGALIGGSVIGPLVTWQGYAFMFVFIGGLWGLVPLIGLFGIREPSVQINDLQKAGSDRSRRHAEPAAESAGKLGGQPFLIVLLVSLLASTSISVTRLGTSLAMDSQQFSAAAVASTATISGLVAIPATWLIGVLSDRLGHRRFLMLGFGLAAGGAVLLSTAHNLALYWLASSLILVAFNVSNAIGAALVTNLLPASRLDSGLSLLSSVNSMAGIVSYASTGVLLAVLGPAVLFLAVAIFPLAGIGLLKLEHQPHREPAGQQSLAPVAYQDCPTCA